MANHINILQNHLSKGKSAKEVLDALKELRDLCAFHQNVSVSLGTALQHLAESLFVQLRNFIFMRRDSYLDHVRPGMKMGTWNELRNTPLFGYGPFPYIPINPRSRKYLRFHLNSQTFQFTAPPLGLATAPLEFTKVVKEGKLMAQVRGIRIHQYLDDWLLRAPCWDTCSDQT